VSQQQPVDTIMHYLAPPPGLSSSFSLFGDSMPADVEELSSSLLNPPCPPQRAPPLMPSRSMTVSFKLPDGLLESEGDDRLSCSSLPARSLPDHRLQDSAKKKTGHSFSHSEGVKKETHSPSRTLFDQSLTPVALPRHVAFTLTQELNSIREQRKELESSLIACVTERENLLQVLRYLQSLRKAVKHPPSAPSENRSMSLHKKRPSSRHEQRSGGPISTVTTLRKQSVGGSRESSGDHSTDSASSQPDHNISQLSALLYAAVSTGLDTTESESRHLSTDSVFREERLPSSGSGVDGAKVRHINEAEEFVHNLLTSSAQDALAEGRASGAMKKTGKPQETEPAAAPLLSLSLSQQIGPPPAALVNEFERLVSPPVLWPHSPSSPHRGCGLLETLWHRDMIIFETVEKYFSPLSLLVAV
jgi:hypothetical protein